MSFYPKITIITPSFNQGKYIEETILSVINQNYPNLQYIIIDGGSTDNTVEIIKKYESSIDYWVSEKDSGQSNAINKGLEKAQGDIIAWLNSDDIYYDNTLNKVSKYFSENPNCNCLIGKLRFIRDSKHGQISANILSKTLEKTAGFINLSQPAMFFRESVFGKIGQLNEKLNYCMDTELWLKTLLISSLKNIIEVNDIFAGFRFHDTSKTVMEMEKFVIEKDRIFFSLAIEYNFHEIASTIQSLENIPNTPISSFLYLEKNDSEKAHKILNYYLLYRGEHYYYYYYNKKKSKRCIQKIKAEILNTKKDQRELLKLKLKLNFPFWLLKLIRTLKSSK